MPTILKTEDQHNVKPRWRHYFVVDVATVTLVEMTPALFGWNVHKIDAAPSGRDWPGMTEAEIVSWKLRNHGSVVLCAADETANVVAMLARKASEVQS